MTEQRLITVAIHTYEKAVMLKSILESEGVKVVLQNVNLLQPVVASGVRVRIQESDLPLALRIIENLDIFADNSRTADVVSGAARQFIVPVDFSAYSMRATEVAFRLAARLHAEILLLHTFINPSLGSSLQFNDTLDFENDITAVELTESLEKQGEKQLSALTANIRARIRNGELPPVKFSTRLLEGIPEEVIITLAKEVKPQLVIMGTRGAGKKERELIGSVTAEVLDSCRFPVLTIPEDSATRLPEPMQVLYFSHLDQTDMLALDALYRMFADRTAEVTVVNVPSKRAADLDPKAFDSLLDYCRSHYAGYTFRAETLASRDVIADFNRIASDRHIDLIVAPSKRRSIFSRIFNPGIPHRLLFHTDTAMMVIPV